MESNGQQEKTKTVSKDQVIAKLKDDGDFDNLRLKIIRKVKDNEELRNSIISIVRQSAALNRPGAENMKPRQLLDAIYDEVGNKMMSKLSDGVWEIIRSGDGMKNEITETVQSVRNKLVEPERKEMGESSTHGVVLVHNEADNKSLVKASTVAVDGNLSNGEPQEPPGFSLSINHQNNHESREELQQPIHCQGPEEEQKEGFNHSKDRLEADDVGPSSPPGFSADIVHKQPTDDTDEDPDVPPGFG
ncbi:uncharacterized protein LOC110608981 isoform X2 [Manihot esculenta]|uniref:Uncharacterized protein n=1 Tax=Manihot esculenta TaxID=3983 RepID=A0ACB7I4B6_MANES|nr:uncharacterized protein LOC110608981 isoform X2 [Manihot esculenta]KAG8659325.1 hypothetical protein MANES_02G029300v8 [Manihot esculenta]